MILSFEERVSNKNTQKKYGVFTLEDFSSSREFRIYRNYDQFRSILKEGEFVQVSAIVRKNEYNGDLFIQIDDLQILDRPWEKFRFQCPIDSKLNFSDLEKIIIENKGKTKLEIEFLDLEKQVSVSMKSKNLGVNISAKFQKKISDYRYKRVFFKLKFKMN